MSSNEIDKEAEIFKDKNYKANINIFSNIILSPSSEDLFKRNSLKLFSLRDILKEDFEILDKKEIDHLIAEIRPNYRSYQLTPNKSKDLNFLMNQSIKNRNDKKTSNYKLEFQSIKKSSIVKS
jgi:hypothetical protein